MSFLLHKETQHVPQRCSSSGGQKSKLPLFIYYTYSYYRLNFTKLNVCRKEIKLLCPLSDTIYFVFMFLLYTVVIGEGLPDKMFSQRINHIFNFLQIIMFTLLFFAVEEFLCRLFYIRGCNTYYSSVLLQVDYHKYIHF